MSATAETSATGRVVDYVLGVKASDLPATVRKEGLRSFFNVLGCTVGGAKHAAVDATWAALKPFAGAPQATLIGRAERTDALTVPSSIRWPPASPPTTTRTPRRSCTRAAPSWRLCSRSPNRRL